MKKEELQKLSTDKLQEKVNGHKTLIGISIALTAFFAYIVITDYLNGKEAEMINWIMIPCLFTGLATLFPELKAIQKELVTRKN